ncbi:MAG: RNA polymerase factor sigma-54 [Planctomycetota bacterium]
MKLNLEARLEQQQVLAPQMILSMDILLLNTTDLELRIEKEFMENPALELEEDVPTPPEPVSEAAPADPEIQALYEILDTYESRYGGDDRPRTQSAPIEDGAKQDALLNHADRPETIVEVLERQVSYLDLDPALSQAARHLAGCIDQRGYLVGDFAEISLMTGCPRELLERALEVIQSLEPKGVGARDLRECLLLQLGREHAQTVEYRLVDECLPELLENRLPRIAERLGVPLDAVRDAAEMISVLHPHPGSVFSVPEVGAIVPELFLDEIEGRFVVRMEESALPSLRISPACSSLLASGGDNKKVLEYIRRKVESARWLIHAIEQRRRTLLDIAQAIVDHQADFFRRGPGHLAALTMQSIADRVKVHVSTVSRATNGKYLESPYGTYELRRLFTGGVERADGGIESRDNVCKVIGQIVAGENPRRPLSDSQLTKKLQERGLDIARRTVTKYRERAGIAPARLRKRY